MEWGILLKMKDKILDGIRKILLKTVVPLKKKRDAIFGNIRLSIANRFAFNYFKLMVINGMLFFFIFIILYLNMERENYSNLAEEVLVNLQADGQYNNTLNPYVSRGINIRIRESDTNREIYSDVTYNIKNMGGIFKKIHLNNSSDKYKLIIEEEMSFYKKGQEYKVTFFFNMTKNLNSMWKLMFNLILVYLLLIFFIMKEAKKDNIKILEPLKAMSATANRLTVNNLHSERLNIDGTKNELKDLAIVFNNMLDRLETSYESQKQFVSDASHELRTPIAVIQGYVNMLSRWGSKDEGILEESIDAVRNEAKSMQDLVEKLLFLSRHDKKTLKLEKKHFNMKPVVEEMVRETKLVAANRVVEGPSLENVEVYGDKQALKQAIRVFIDNAVKYTREGDRISITCKNVRGDCIITVQDTGIGMIRKDVDNIFNRFYRSDHVRDRKIDGHGLGLSIAKLIIMAHTGKIKVRSQYTKGTSFIVTIPRIFYT